MTSMSDLGLDKQDHEEEQSHVCSCIDDTPTTRRLSVGEIHQRTASLDPAFGTYVRLAAAAAPVHLRKLRPSSAQQEGWERCR